MDSCWYIYRDAFNSAMYGGVMILSILMIIPFVLWSMLFIVAAFKPPYSYRYDWFVSVALALCIISSCALGLIGLYRLVML
jgi:hypothetical protein